jgi:hypothetical protein
MRRWIVVVATLVLLAGCGIDEDELVATSDPGGTTTTTTASGSTTTTAPSGTEPSSGDAAEDLLLDAGDLGPAWTQGDPGTLPEIPTCPETHDGPDPTDHAQTVLVRGEFGPVLLQTVAIFGSEEDAAAALAAFGADLDACDNAVIDVEDLSFPAFGDASRAVRLHLGDPVLDTTAEVVGARAGDRTTVIASVNFASPATEDLPDIVETAVGKL